MKFLPLLALLISPFVSALTRDDLQQRFYRTTGDPRPFRSNPDD